MAGVWSHAVVYIGRHLWSGWANCGWHRVELWAPLRGRQSLAWMSSGPSLVAPPDDTGVTGGRQVVDTFAESYHPPSLIPERLIQLCPPPPKTIQNRSQHEQKTQVLKVHSQFARKLISRRPSAPTGYKMMPKVLPKWQPNRPHWPPWRL